MRLYLVRLILSVYIICLSSSAAFAETRYQVTEIPDAVPAQYLTRDGHVLGLDWTSGDAVLWSDESDIATIQAQNGYKWSRVVVSPGGRFLGAAYTDDHAEVYFEGQLGSYLSPVQWPPSLPIAGSQGGTSAGGAAGGITICSGPCPPDIPPSPPYVPSPPRYFASAINDEGVIAGFVSIDRNSGHVLQSPEIDAFRLHPNGQIDVMNGLQAVSINSRGDALVKSMFLGACGPADNKFLWTAGGELLSPDLLPGYAGLVRPILNDLGGIAGTATDEDLKSIFGNPASGNVQGFRWTLETGTVALDLLPGFTSSIVHGLNNIGSAVGEATNTNSVCGPITIFDPATISTVAVIWGHDGHVVDLNTVVKEKHEHDASGVASLTDASAINDAGQILAFGVDKSGKPHNYLLSPRRDPDSGRDKRLQHGGRSDAIHNEDDER
jgi:hypothetical protein